MTKRTPVLTRAVDHPGGVAELLANSRATVIAERGFAIDLFPRDPDRQLRSKADFGAQSFKRVFHESFQPLVRAAVSARLYNLTSLRNGPPPSASALRIQYSEAERADWTSRYTREAAGASEIALGTPGLDEDEAFWWWVINGGANPVFVLPAEGFDWPALFANLFDPTAVSPPGGTAGRAAVAGGRRAISGKKNVALIIERDFYGVSVVVVASGKRPRALFEQAVGNAGFTPAFVALHCTPWVRPFEMGGWELLDEIKDEGFSAEPLRTVLGEAMADASNADVAIPALAAAELIAALNGHPPATFSEARPQDHGLVVKWLARARGKLHIEPRLVADAKRTVTAIAKRSTLPHVLWKTEGFRDAWRREVKALQKRL